MTLPESYLITTKNLEPLLNALLTAQAPTNFTQKFLEQLEFNSSNDRLYIGIFKALGFLDANGTPTERYYKFLDQSESRVILAEAIREAYSDLFAINRKANEMTVNEVKNKFKTLTQGGKSDKVLGLMANTFTSLCKYAEWDSVPKDKDSQDQTVVKTSPQGDKPIEKIAPPQNMHSLHYNLQIHLPDSRDPAVFDAIFRSLKQHIF